METSITSLIKSSLLEIFQEQEIVEKIEDLIISGALKAYQIISDKESSNKLLTIAEVSKLFGKSTVCIHGWAKKGILTKHKLKGSSRTYFKPSEIEKALIEMKSYKTI